MFAKLLVLCLCFSAAFAAQWAKQAVYKDSSCSGEPTITTFYQSATCLPSLAGTIQFVCNSGYVTTTTCSDCTCTNPTSANFTSACFANQIYSCVDSVSAPADTQGYSYSQGSNCNSPFQYQYSPSGGKCVNLDCSAAPSGLFGTATVYGRSECGSSSSASSLSAPILAVVALVAYLMMN